MAMVGTDVAWAQSPLEAMGDDPAGLGFLTRREFDFGGFVVVPDGHFSKPAAASSSDLKSPAGGLPELAFGLPLGQSSVSVGLSFIPEATLLAEWNYLDPTNSKGISYGNQPEQSEIILLRSALGAGIALTPQLSLGASIGAVYNENRLEMPYVFQNLAPAGDATYNGDKTLLNLHTSGFGWNVQAGLIYRPVPGLQFGLAYKSRYTVHSTGGASGDPYAQFGAPPGPLAFHYDAEVDNTFPQQVSLGGSWKFHPQWRIAAQVDWIDWSDAFRTLPVILKNGGNATVNSVLGSSFQDHIPLNWQDEFVYRAGLEYAVTKNLALRAGYSFGRNPVPDATLTPVTAAILEQTVTAGVGYQWHRVVFDLAYQYDLPVTRSVGASSLLAGEYANSTTTVSAHWIGLTTRFIF